MKIIGKGVFFKNKGKTGRPLIICLSKDQEGNEIYILEVGKREKIIHRILRSIIYDILEERGIYLDILDDG